MKTIALNIKQKQFIMSPQYSEAYKIRTVPIEITYKGQTYTGSGIPLPGSFRDGVCFELDITLNNKNLGTIRYDKSGWKMTDVKDQAFVDALGEEIFLWYE
jgi:hypothetical protein